MNTRVRVIRPCSRERDIDIAARIRSLAMLGFDVRFAETAPDPNWPYSSSDIATRSRALTQALCEDVDVVWCARGGYGAADLLPLIPWENLTGPPKWLVGFSDVCALHSALFTKAGWKCLHAPMPATTLWPEDLTASDLVSTSSILQGKSTYGEMPIERAIGKKSGSVEGWLFGGNLSVLTNLIGTPYFPKSLTDCILLLEDLTESPGRLVRQFMQWRLSGVLDGVRAIVLGSFHSLGKDVPDNDPRLIEQIASRALCPVYKSGAFGHVGSNLPFAYGALATVSAQKLQWSISRQGESLHG